MTGLIMSVYPWQQQQWRRLTDQYRQKRLPHAILLSGNPGLGKLGFAQYFAHYLLCKKPDEQPCGQCASCHLTSVGNHPDLLNIFRKRLVRILKLSKSESSLLLFSKRPNGLAITSL